MIRVVVPARQQSTRFVISRSLVRIRQPAPLRPSARRRKLAFETPIVFVGRAPTSSIAWRSGWMGRMALTVTGARPPFLELIALIHRLQSAADVTPVDAVFARDDLRHIGAGGPPVAAKLFSMGLRPISDLVACGARIWSLLATSARMVCKLSPMSASATASLVAPLSVHAQFPPSFIRCPPPRTPPTNHRQAQSSMRPRLANGGS
jgi:hypothetical protein